MILYGTPLSGHTHRVAALLRQLELPYDFIEAPAAFRRSAEFRAITPFGQIPVLVDGGQSVPDSNAILIHLAKKYDPGRDWLPEDHDLEVEVHRWLSIAAGDIRFGPALARLITQFGYRADLEGAKAVARPLLEFMDSHLSSRDWLVGSRPTIADLACYPYVATAPEGGVELELYPHILEWIGRVERIPRFDPMPRIG